MMGRQRPARLVTSMVQSGGVKAALGGGGAFAVAESVGDGL